MNRVQRPVADGGRRPKARGVGLCLAGWRVPLISTLSRRARLRADGRPPRACVRAAESSPRGGQKKKSISHLQPEERVLRGGARACATTRVRGHASTLFSGALPPPAAAVHVSPALLALPLPRIAPRRDNRSQRPPPRQSRLCEDIHGYRDYLFAVASARSLSAVYRQADGSVTYRVLQQDRGGREFRLLTSRRGVVERTAHGSLGGIKRRFQGPTLLFPWRVHYCRFAEGKPSRRRAPPPQSSVAASAAFRINISCRRIRVASPSDARERNREGDRRSRLGARCREMHVARCDPPILTDPYSTL